MNESTVNIRKAVEEDSDQLWILMKERAVFEDYIGPFAITPDVVRQSDFKKDMPDIYCIVAEAAGKIVGMFIYYYLQYTAQNRPAVYMKELYVEERLRGQKIGERLMNALKEEARLKNCTQIKRTVAPWNEGGKRFYERLGASENKNWLHYEWEVCNGV